MSKSEALRIVTPLLRGEEDGVSEAVEPTRTPIVMQQSAKAQDEFVLRRHYRSATVSTGSTARENRVEENSVG